MYFIYDTHSLMHNIFYSVKHAIYIQNNVCVIMKVGLHSQEMTEKSSQPYGDCIFFSFQAI
jgi:hypothetical protein